jgi:hypothetical protein
MRPRSFVPWFFWLGLSACNPFDNDTGTAEPRSWWPWVCADGGPATDAGCLPMPRCPDGEALDAGVDGGC